MATRLELKIQNMERRMGDFMKSTERLNDKIESNMRNYAFLVNQIQEAIKQYKEYIEVMDAYITKTEEYKESLMTKELL